MLAKASNHRAASLQNRHGMAPAQQWMLAFASMTGCLWRAVHLDTEHRKRNIDTMPKSGWLYLLASAPRGTLYLGVTSDLPNRIRQHREEYFAGFTARYGVKLLVWNDHYTDIADAVRHERMMKTWKRDWKIRLIEEHNPLWIDLAEGMGFPPLPRISER